MGSDIELAWAAGFFDGEGTIHVSRSSHRNGNIYHQLQIAVSQRDVRPLQALCRIFGGWLGQRKTGVYVWSLKSAKAAEALQRLRPYFVYKGDQADIAISFQARRARGSAPVSDPGQDAADYLELRRLKTVWYGR